MIRKKIFKLDKYHPVLQESFLYEDSLKLDWNELSDFENVELKKHLINRMSSLRLSWYAPIENSNLNSLLCRFCGVNEGSIRLFNGSDYAHEIICRTFLDNDDDILIVRPNYDNFRLVAESICRAVHYYDINPESIPDLNHLSLTISKTLPKLVYISRPNNPTGYCIELDQIRQLINKHINVLFLIDEAYIEFSDKKSSVFLIDSDNLIVTRTFSKAFGIAGLKLGYAIASQNLIQNLDYLRNSKCINTFALIAGEFLLNNINAVTEVISDVKKNREIFATFLKNKNLQFYPSEGNFILIKLFSPEIAQSLFNHFKSEKIYVRLYTIAGQKSFVRITIPSNNINLNKIINTINTWKI
jgi:histidinol-phosphate aminotransferase